MTPDEQWLERQRKDDGSPRFKVHGPLPEAFLRWTPADMTDEQKAACRRDAYVADFSPKED